MAGCQQCTRGCERLCPPPGTNDPLEFIFWHSQPKIETSSRITKSPTFEFPVESLKFNVSAYRKIMVQFSTDPQTLVDHLPTGILFRITVCDRLRLHTLPTTTSWCLERGNRSKSPNCFQHLMNVLVIWWSPKVERTYSSDVLAVAQDRQGHVFYIFTISKTLMSVSTK